MNRASKKSLNFQKMLFATTFLQLEMLHRGFSPKKTNKQILLLGCIFHMFGKEQKER